MTEDPMSLAEFDDLAFAHGGDVARWPADRRAAAERLAAGSAEAAARLAQMTALDDALGAAAPADPQPSDDLMARILADAATLAPAAPRAQPAATLSWRDRLGRALSLDVLSPVAAFGASIAVGLWLGYAGPADVYGVASDVLALSAPTEFAMLDDVGEAPFVDALAALEITE